jgi:hypothetical protein
MDNKKLSSIEWLIDNLYLKDSLKWEEILEQAKAMHKEEMINAVDGFPLANRNLDGSEYYEKTYGGDK